MKISAIEILRLDLPVVRPHAMAIGTTTKLVDVFVRMFADDGTIGFGESPFMVGHSQSGETPESAVAVLATRLAPAVMGMSPLDQEGLTLAMNRRVPGNLRAKGAIVMAAYDLAGKILSTPVYNLLGGKVRDAVPLSWSLPLVDAKAAVEEGERMVKRGWRILKLKMGRPNPQDDVEVAHAVRDALGPDVKLRADANQAYDVKTALRVIAQLESLGLEFFEQPTAMNDIEALRRVRDATSIPIMADESATTLDGLSALLLHRAIDAVSIYVIGPGGLHQSKKMAALAEACNIRGYVGGALETAVGAAAGLHLAASSPSISLGCEMNGQFLLTDSLAESPMLFMDGALHVPTGPGLGVAICEESLERYRVGSVTRLT